MGKAAAADLADGQKMIPADCVSVLMALSNTQITKAHLDMMSALDGTRTASSFQHQFRSIAAKAKDLKARVDAGEAFVPVQPSKKRNEKVSSTTSQKRKNMASGREEAPSKKARTAPKSGRKNVSNPIDGLDNLSNEGFPRDAENFIKQEQDWEHDFAWPDE